MSFPSILSRVFLCAIALTALAYCGGKETKSSKVTLTVQPDRPIVITADAEYEGTQYTAPWFAFNVYLENGSDEQFTIVALYAEVITVSSSGNFQTINHAWSVSDFEGGNDANGGHDCQFQDFGTWQPGEDKPLFLDALPYPDHDHDGPCNKVAPFAIGGLPKNTNTNSYRYRVKVKPLGWFGSYEEPADRFEKQGFFYTQ